MGTSTALHVLRLCNLGTQPQEAKPTVVIQIPQRPHRPPGNRHTLGTHTFGALHSGALRGPPHRHRDNRPGKPTSTNSLPPVREGHGPDAPLTLDQARSLHGCIPQRNLIVASQKHTCPIRGEKCPRHPTLWKAKSKCLAIGSPQVCVATRNSHDLDTVRGESRPVDDTFIAEGPRCRIESKAPHPNNLLRNSEHTPTVW